MPRIRTVKPELFKHEALFEAEMTSNLPLRLAFIGLFTCCDRGNRFKWRPKLLKLDLLPYDDIDIVAILEQLVQHGFVKKHKYQGEWYGYIPPSWAKHQQINNSEVTNVLSTIPNSRATITTAHYKNQQLKFMKLKGEQLWQELEQ